MKNERLFSNLFFFVIATYHIMIQTHSRGVNTMLYVFPFVIMWFFFRAGVYFRDEFSENIHQRIKTAARNYLIPYFTFLVIGICTDLYYGDSLSYLVRYGAPHSNSPIWFFLALFIVHILFRYLVKFSIPAIALLLPIADWFLKTRNLSIPFGGNVIIYGTFYYACGYYFQKYKFLHRLSSKFVCIAIYALLILKEPVLAADEGQITLHGNIMNYVFTLASITAYRALMGWLPNMRAKFVPHHFGSMMMCVHWPVIYFMHANMTSEQFHTTTTTIAAIGLTIIIGYAISIAYDKVYKTPLLDGRLKL